MSKKYIPELGQFTHGNSFDEYECPEYVIALFQYIIEEIERVYWNRNQKEWDKYEDPKIPRIKYKSYYWGEDPKEAKKPNFSFDTIELRWYKHIGRGMIVNQEYTVGQWQRWFDRCIKQIRKYDKKL